MSEVIRVIAAVVDVNNLTLYKEDGEEHIIKQGDPELHRVLGIVMPIIQDGGIAEVEIGQSADKGKEFTDFEAKTNGFIRFFKVMKEQAEKFLTQLGANTDHVAPLTLGRVPTKNPAVSSVVVKRKDETKDAEQKAAKQAAVAEVLANAIPTSSDKFTAPKADQHDESGKLVVEGEETIIAVVGDGTVVPGVEKLAGQFEYAAREGNSTIGMERFLARLGKVIAERNHSVKDLLKFLERGDLPIADDGSFVAYKILKNKHDQKGVFVDCHTGLVPQRVGSYVHMDHSLVDHNRSNECSNGLHVARRGYIGSFYGDVCTLIKVNPEDVIAVPNYDANKMRVCGYHIIDLLTAADFRKLKSDNAMTDTMAAREQLGKALAGDHVGIIESVKIGGHKGTNVVVTPMAKPVKQAKVKAKAATAIEAKKVVKKVGAEKVDATAIAKQVAAQKASGGSARQAKAADMLAVFNNAKTAREVYDAAKALVDFKKAAKVSWDKLGIGNLTGDDLVAKASTEPVFQEPVEEPEAVAVRPRGKVTKASAAVKATCNIGPITTAKTTDRQAELRALMLKVNKKDVQAAYDALTIKKKSKKSWEALGLTKAEGEKIVKLAGK